MKIIIPMTGYGSRFVAAGYQELKPFIKVQGRKIIEWIVKGMYSREDEFLFVCRQEHLSKIQGMEDQLRSLAPKTKIFAVDNWEKKGPVSDVFRASEMIEDDEPCIVNYCDFYQEWNYKQFCEKVAGNHCDGAVPCYSGFHPHLLIAKNLYASCKTDSEDYLLEIREKYSFEDDKMKAKHSPGVYYFRNGEILKKYFEIQLKEGMELNGEHYVSLVYNRMVQDGLKVWVPVNVPHFCQWGTPEDLKDYLFWTELTRRYQR